MGRAVQSWNSFSKRLYLDGECWRFQGCHDKDGYGISAIKGTKMPAHRAAFILWYNEPAVFGKYVLHKCTHRDCCNPAHLYVGTQKQNIQDQIDAGTFVYGSKNGMAKLTDEEVVYSRASGLSCRVLADKFNVSYYTMWDVLKKRSWKHLL